MTDDNPITQDTGQDSGGKAHTGLDEPHPAGPGARTDRETGGPTTDDGDAPENLGADGVKGTDIDAVEPDR